MSWSCSHCQTCQGQQVMYQVGLFGRGLLYSQVYSRGSITISYIFHPNQYFKEDSLFIQNAKLGCQNFLSQVSISTIEGQQFLDIFFNLQLIKEFKMQMKFDPNNPPTYEMKKPFRFVKPYDHQFVTHTKKRWLKRKLIQVLTSEFKAYSKQYYLKAIEDGRITINKKETTSEYVLRDNDLLVHKTVRIEPPVLDLEVEIISEDDDFVAVNKPPGVTIHTGGGYHYNTLLAILFFEHKMKNLYLLHRLDKCTSGVILFGKNKEISLKFHEQNSKFIMQKMYYARVSGDFDDKLYGLVDKPLVCLNYKNGVYSVFDKEKHQNNPDYTKEIPKQSQTQFKKLWYDQESDSSLVQCHPKTGRTHQIRVHLSYCKHPILNDTNYGGRFLGNLVLKVKYGAQEYKKMLEEPIKVSKIEEDEGQEKIRRKIKLNDGKAVDIKEQNDDEANLDEREWDIKQKAMEICLHSSTYKFEGKVFQSKKPYWFEKKLPLD